MSKTFLIFIFLVLCACQKENFKEYSKLEDLRVVAILSSASEVNPGDTVTLTPYISDITASGPYTYVAKSCVDPGVAYGANPSCSGNATSVSIGSGSVTGLSSPNYTGAVNTLSVTVPATLLSTSSDVDKYNGVSYLVTYDITNASGKTVSAFHRIVVSDSSKTAKNSHPVISSITANGSTLGTLSVGSEVSLSVSLSSSSSETYSYKKTDGSLSTATESPLITYFYTDGKMKYLRTSLGDTNTFTAPDSYPTARNSLIIIVARDGRGGISLQSTTIH